MNYNKDSSQTQAPATDQEIDEAFESFEKEIMDVIDWMVVTLKQRFRWLLLAGCLVSVVIYVNAQSLVEAFQAGNNTLIIHHMGALVGLGFVLYVMVRSLE